MENKNTGEQIELNTRNEEKLNRTSDFKKPIFIGKIGKFPRKSLKLNSKETNSTLLKEPQLENIETNDTVQPSVIKKTVELKETHETFEREETDHIKKESVESTLQLQYTEPLWSSIPITKDVDYKFEVLKSGVIIETINLMSKSFWVFGRLPQCDICMAHPTISRYHAVLQYNGIEITDRPVGFYIYDLGSTHGTFLNKNRIKSKMYVRIQVGHMIKLGNSTRNYILQGPDSDSEPESELGVTELKQKRAEELKKREMEMLAALEKEKSEKMKQEELEREQGIDWGMGEDADEETDLTENPYAATNNEELYLDDPKKTLRGFFEREGCDLEYDVEEKGMGQFLCRVELPIDNSVGKPIVAEVLHKGKKKEAVIQCALEACRILDRVGVLRQANQESRKRKIKNWEEDDFYDSDDDEYLDRTGAIQKKRERRMKLYGKITQQPVVETYDSLKTKEEELLKVIFTKEQELNEALNKLSVGHSNSNNDDIDSLDAYMNNLKDSKPNKQMVHGLKSQIIKLKQEHEALKKLINIAQPANLPKLINTLQTSDKKEKNKQKLPIIGKRLKSKPVAKINQAESVKDDNKIEQEEEFDDHSEEQSETICTKNSNSLAEVSFKSKENSSSENDINISTNNKDNESRIIGPCVPENLSELLNKTSDNSLNCENSSKEDIKNNEKSRKRNQRRAAHKEKIKLKYISENHDDNYSMWLPPEDQEGDGKTKLNDRYGY